MQKTGTLWTTGIALIWVILFSLTIQGRSEAALTDANYGIKAAVEAHIEARLRDDLREIAGTENILAIVNASVKEDLTPSFSSTSENSHALVLPGVPVQKEIGKTDRTPQPAPMLPPAKIEKLNVVVLVDTSVSADLLPVLREISSSAMGFNAERGDKLDVRQVAFQGQTFKWARFFFPPHIYYILLIFLGSFFVLSAAHFLRDPFGNLASALRNVDWDAVRGRVPSDSHAADADASLAPLKIAEPEATMIGSDVPVPFSFVKERHIPEIAYLLSKSPDQDIAVVVNYLSPELAAKLIERFTPERQIAIATILNDGTDISPERVSEIENRVRMKVDYVIGGDGKLIPILNMMKADIREAVIDSVESKDSDAAMRLKRKLRSFETLVRDLTPLSIQALYRQLNPSMVAQILKASPADVQEKFFTSISEGATQRLREEMELSHSLTENRLRREKNNVLAVARRMASAGLIEELED